MARLSLSGSPFSDTAITGNAIMIMVPSNWCMNWAQPTISGTMTEKRGGEGGEDIGRVMQDARPRRKPCGMPSKHGERYFLAWRHKAAVEVLEVVRREGE